MLSTKQEWNAESVTAVDATASLEVFLLGLLFFMVRTTEEIGSTHAKNGEQTINVDTHLCKQASR